MFLEIITQTRLSSDIAFLLTSVIRTQQKGYYEVITVKEKKTKPQFNRDTETSILT